MVKILTGLSYLKTMTRRKYNQNREKKERRDSYITIVISTVQQLKHK